MRKTEQTDLETRLNTLSVSVLTCITLVYLCSFINAALALAAFFSIVPLYVFVQRHHARYALLEKIWYLDCAWRYVFPFALYLIVGELIVGLFVGYEAYHVYGAYVLRTFVVGVVLVRYRRLYTELTDRRWAIDGLAVLVGALIFALWAGLEGYYPLFSEASSHFDPSRFGTSMLVMLLSVRLVGSVLVAAVIEELFTRSFLMRYVIDPERWAEVPMGTYTFTSFMVVALFFGVAHFRWLPGILTGILLNLLLYRRRDIRPCVEAHAIANLLLFLYVAWTESWFFW